MQRKFLAILLCVAMLATMFTGLLSVSADTAADVSMIYVSDSAGDNANDGTTEQTPLKSLAAAVNRVNELGLTGENRVIKVLGCAWKGLSLYLKDCNPYDEMITITASPNVTIWSNGDIYLSGPLTLDARFGNAASQNGIVVNTYGHEFVLGNNAEDANGAKGNATINTGYYHSSNGIAASNGVVEYNKDINLGIYNDATNTVAGIYVGNMETVDAVVQYNNANIVIDNPNLTVSTLKIGNYGNYNKGINDFMNKFNTINFTVNNVASIGSLTGATYYNAVYTVNLQMVYNNGTATKVNDNIDYGNWPKMLKVNNKWVMKSDATDGSYLEVTETAGTFKVYGGKIATATDGTNTYESVNGMLTVPKGTYTVTYRLPDKIYVHNKNGLNTNDGLTSATPLKTIAAAINKINALGLTGENRVVYVMQSEWNGMSFDFSSCTKYDEMITVKSAGITVWGTTHMYLAGPLTVDTKYGNSSSQVRTQITTNGYEFVLGANAKDDKDTQGDAVIKTGYDHSKLGLTADATTGYIEYGKDINLGIYNSAQTTISNIQIGNYQYVDKPVQYGNANIVFDNPNLNVTKINIGNAGNYKGSTQSNRFKTINFTVNNIASIGTITGATYYNATYATNLQMVYNNGTSAKVNDALAYGGYGNTMMYAANKWVMKSDATDGSYLEVTENAGTFKVYGDKTAIATNGTNTYESANGILTVPKGTYTVRYEKMMGVYVDCTNGNDENDGQSSGAPLKTLAAAIAKINTLGLKGDERVITILKCDWNGASFDFSSLDSYDEMITVRTKVSGTTIWSKTNLSMVGPLTFDFAYGNSDTQSGLVVYTHGYDFVLGENANDAKGTTSIYAGYDSAYDSNVPDETTGYVEYGKDINVSILTENTMKVNLYIGNANYIDTAPVQYGDANILIDAPYVEILNIKFGNPHGNYSDSTGARMNRYNNVNLTVNDVAEIGTVTGATYYNGIYAQNVQFMFNNETFDSIANYELRFGQHYENTMITAQKRWIVKENTDFEDAYISLSDKVGTFNVNALLIANADNGTAHFTSKNGVLELPAGEYTVSYTDPGAYVITGDTFTAVKEVKGLNITNILDVQADGRVLIGWKNADGTVVADTTSVSLAAGQTLTAVYADFDIDGSDGSADYTVSNIEMRASKNIGIRFTIDMSDAFAQIFSDVTGVKYGYLVLPKFYINKGETLTVDNTNAAQRDNLNTAFTYLNDEKTSFSACVVDIKANHYDAVYCVRGFVTYTDINGNVRTAYTNIEGYSLLEVAYMVTADSENYSAKEILAAQSVIDSCKDNLGTTLKAGVKSVADSVGDEATGTVYYVSNSGKDTNNGKSPETAWATIQRVNEANLSYGDAVLFERGGMYRMYKVINTHKTLDIVSGVSYGTYGTGEKPIINGSFKNYAEETWTKYADNIYYLSLNYKVDPGVLRITTNSNLSYTGTVKDSIDALNTEWDFCWADGKVYLYCPYAHPNSLLKDIEIGFGADMFKLDGAQDVVIENLAFTLGGRHAVCGVNNPTNIIVRGCEFSYIGGCLTDNYEINGDMTRLGNAVEFLGSSTNILVENCSFYSIYDSGVTFQGGASAGSNMKVDGFTVRNCVFDSCGLGSFEYWIGGAGTANDILLEGNYMVNAGCGHGGVAKRTVKSHSNAHIRADGVNITSNFRIQNNIFDGCAQDAYLLALCCNSSSNGSFPELYRNIYIQNNDEVFISVKDTGAGVSLQVNFDQNAYSYLVQNVDKQPVVIFK